MAKPFIKFHKNLDDALSFSESPVDGFFEYKAIQLLPNQTDAYVQFTDHKTGIELEDWEVFAVSLCGTRTDITENFQVFANFTDTSGMPQIIWQLINLPELGNGFVYLEVNQLLGETFYTSPFQITEYKSEFTARFDYKDKKTDWYQSIQLKTWFRQKLNRDELTTYYEISTGNTVTAAYKKSTIEKWHTELFSNEFMIQFRDLLNTRIKYINKYRFNLYEAFEVPELTGNANYEEQQYLLSVNYNDLLTENPNEMGLVQEIEEIKAILRPILEMNTPLLFLRPANEIPPGYVEYTGLAGYFPVGRLEGDADFGTLLNTGGAKTDSVTLSIANLPAHDHTGGMYNTGTGTPLFTLKGLTDGSDTVYSKTETTGGGEAFEIDLLNPYRIVNYIIWAGL